MNRTESPIALQSKRWIMESLIELMNKKTFQEITISELTAHADLGRRTFYRNFTSKEDVLEFYFQNLIQELIDYLSIYENLTPKICLHQIFTLCNDNKTFLTGLNRSKMLGFLLDQWNSSLPTIHEMMIDKIPNFPNQYNEVALAYTLAFNTGGVWNVVSKWISSDMEQTPEEMTTIVMDLIKFNYENS
ncbi:TetR/AcrR family transcriptional regulator [Inconstantimicrobium mannanitabidum]|uniref:AcrR family transcriptional regulator n=1 Tax=Inconstantimicrobium mannanitabidum TaxID=1604901 RepID=A0ACB5RDU5_9CLOT|nr:TetR/AcrR family transcriptional regulator [Clostridium sp. TW13]GKX67281.1 AcrR family transcriptional regulator [Clostridium sp. TW13]